ncbi:MAG: BON domain-containing protein [Planctomycetes bacterium]|nr:BON domain-containing protein [Planctomycetota bacterium]
MAKSQFAPMMSMVVAVAAGCLFSVPEACGQFQRDDQQRNFGVQNSGVFRGGQQGGAVTGQQGGAFNSVQQGPTSGPQFGPGQQPGAGTANTRQGGFVGSDAQDMRRSFENMSSWQQRRVRFDMVVESLNEMRESRRQRDRRRRRPDPIRVQLRPSFDYPQLESRQVAVTLQSNLTRALDLQGLVAPRVELDGRTVTVSGSVPNEHERAVIERMLALQPGVSIVKNLLTIDPAAAATEPSSAESSSAEKAAD